jgi:hypothetical protein
MNNQRHGHLRQQEKLLENMRDGALMNLFQKGNPTMNKTKISEYAPNAVIFKNNQKQNTFQYNTG